MHTLQCIEDDTHVWFHMYGANLNLDADGNVESVTDGAGTLAAYYALCEAQGLPAPERARRLTVPRPSSLCDPDAYVDGARRTRCSPSCAARNPVYWQDMPDEPGYWAVLKHADVVHVAREPSAVLGERGRRGAREPRRAERSR